MSVRVRPPGAGIDRPLAALTLLAVMTATIGALWLVPTAIGGRPDYRTVQVDNQAGLPLQVDAGLGQAGPQATTTFYEVADPGRSWTFVVSYGGQELLRQPVTSKELAARGWTVQLPDGITEELEQQGYR